MTKAIEQGHILWRNDRFDILIFKDIKEFLHTLLDDKQAKDAELNAVKGELSRR